MKQQVFWGIFIRIVILFSIAMAATFLPEQLRDFFGDTLKIEKEEFSDFVDPDWNWGVRHYWYFWMCVLLFFLGVANIVIGVFNIVRKNYNTSNW